MGNIFNKSIYVYFYILLGFSLSYAQIDSLYENIGDLQTEDGSLMEFLEELTDNPLNINDASREDFENLSLLSPDQIDSLLLKRPFRNKTEVKLILGKQTYNAIRAFFIIKRPSPALEFKFTNRIQYTLEKSKGIKEGKYKNSPYNHYSRIFFSAGKDASGGFLTQKDAGESNLTDHWTGFFQWYDKEKGHKIIAGHYRIDAGQGLALSSPYSIRKSSFVLAPLSSSSARGRPFLSSEENEGFYGLFSNIRVLDNFNLAGFYSQKKKDAMLADDTLLVTGFDRTGYHRTDSEISKRNLVEEKCFGGIVNFSFWKFKNLGFSSIQVKYNPPIVYDSLSQSEKNLRRDHFHFNGEKINISSAFYSITINGMIIDGEVALNDFNSPAHQHGMIVSHESWKMGLRWWRIPKNIQLPFGRSFSSNTSFPQGKEGFYFAASGSVTNNLLLNTYWNIEKDLWRTYLDPLPVNKRDYFFQLDWSLNSTTHVLFRYQSVKDQYYTSDIFQSIEERRNKIRLQITKKLSSGIRMTSRLEKVFINYSSTFNKKQGINIYQDLRWDITPQLKISTRYSSFKTADYGSRIYEYENDIPGTFSIFPQYGQGNKWYILIQYNFWQKVKLWLKYRRIYFDGAETIGSGNSEITGDTKQDIRFQIAYRY